MNRILDQRPLVLMSSTLTLCLSAAAAKAVDPHHDDIRPAIANQQLVLENHAEIDASTGYLLFEGDFGDFEGGLNKTDAPGYKNLSGPFSPNSFVGFRAVGSLLAWNGSAWGTAAPGVSFSIMDLFNDTITWTGSGVSGLGWGYIDQIDANGHLHNHVDMTIAGTNSSSNPAAYLVSLALFNVANVGDTATLVADSTPFSLVLNHGLLEADFESAVAARVVPLPAAAWLFLGGLAGLSGRVRRQRVSREG